MQRSKYLSLQTVASIVLRENRSAFRLLDKVTREHIGFLSISRTTQLISGMRNEQCDRLLRIRLVQYTRIRVALNFFID